MEKERSSLASFIKAAFFMLSLLLVLAVLTSLNTGISMFDREVMSLLSTIFILSLCILGVLALSVFAVAIFGSKNSSGSGQSALIKDNTLRYETKGENGRKKKVSIDLRKIDSYLSQYSELYMIKGTKLIKKDKKAKPNANTLFLVKEDGSQISLNELSKADAAFYNEVCGFLDRIKNKDAIDLSFRMRKYATESDLILSGRETMAKFKLLSRKVKNRKVKEKINETITRIKDAEPEIIDHSDQLRKLYDHYLPMLVQITDDYITMEGHDQSIVDISSSRQRLLDTFVLIDSVFTSMGSEEEAVGIEELDADVQKVNALLAKNDTETLKK